MSTSAAIGVRQPDGTVRAIRLNWDGYVAHAGAILGGWYKTAEEVNALIALGDLSEINETVETCWRTTVTVGSSTDSPEPLPTWRTTSIAVWDR